MNQIRTRFVGTLVLSAILACLVAASSAPPLACNQLLSQSFGLVGQTSPTEMKLAMCPEVKDSCCTVNDQITIFENWEYAHEHSRLQERLQYQRDVYVYSLNLAEHVNQLALATIAHFADTTVSNCKVLAKRITHYQIDQVAPKLVTALDSLHDWWGKVYGGVYCAVCDAHAHRHFDLQNERIEYSVKFCRNLVMKTLPVLLYMTTHYTKYMNLVIQFASSCDVNGQFTEDAYSQADLFNVDVVLRKKLERCRDSRNSDEWYSKCSFLCDDFNMVTFPKTFEPYIQHYSETNRFLHNQLYRFEYRANGSHLDANHTRVLEASPSPKPAEGANAHQDSGSSSNSTQAHPKISLEAEFWSVLPPEANPITDTNAIIMSVENSSFDFENFEEVWVEDGLSLDEYGQYAVISHAKYEKLYAEKVARQLAGAGIAAIRVLVLAVVGLAASI